MKKQNVIIIQAQEVKHYRCQICLKNTVKIYLTLDSLCLLYGVYSITEMGKEKINTNTIPKPEFLAITK